MSQPPTPLHYQPPQPSGDGCRKTAEFIAGGVCGVILFICVGIATGMTIGQHVSGATLLVMVFAAGLASLVGGIFSIRKTMFVGGMLIGFCVVSLMMGVCFTALNHS